MKFVHSLGLVFIGLAACSGNKAMTVTDGGVSVDAGTIADGGAA